MMKYGEKFEKFFRKGAQILAFSKRNFFSRSRFMRSNDEYVQFQLSYILSERNAAAEQLIKLVLVPAL